MTGYCLFDTALGACGIAWRGETVIATRLPDETREETARRLGARTGAGAAPPPAAIRAAIDAITALLDGTPRDLSGIACDLGESDPFSAEVYARARAIPPGETVTYGDIALGMGDKRLAQRVGQALGRNPLPIIVPCHRVLGADGKLVGFSAHGGVAMKLRMLEIEGAEIGPGPGLFGDLPLAMRPPH